MEYGTEKMGPSKNATVKEHAQNKNAKKGIGQKNLPAPGSVGEKDGPDQVQKSSGWEKDPEQRMIKQRLVIQEL